MPFDKDGEEGRRLIINKLNNLTESKNYDFLYDLFEGGYLSSNSDDKFIEHFPENLDHNIYRKILDALITKFMKKWKKWDHDIEYLFDSGIFRTLYFLNHS